MFYLAGKKLHDLTEAESVVQDVFLDLWERRKILSIEKLENYLAVAVKYRVLNLLARREKERQIIDAQRVTASNIAPTPEEWLTAEEIQTWLHSLTQSLPEKCRIVYELRDEGLSQREIADRMGISVKTVQAHIGKAIRILRTGIGQLWTILLLFGTVASSLVLNLLF